MLSGTVVVTKMTLCTDIAGWVAGPTKLLHNSSHVLHKIISCIAHSMQSMYIAVHVMHFMCGEVHNWYSREHKWYYIMDSGYHELHGWYIRVQSRCHKLYSIYIVRGHSHITKINIYRDIHFSTDLDARCKTESVYRRNKRP
jgi:hypothetical protein